MMGRKPKIIMGLIVLVAIAFGVYYFGLPMLKGNDNPINPTPSPGGSEVETLVSIESIRELAKTSNLKINTTVESKIHVDNDPNTGNRIDLMLENGKLYLISGTNKSSIKDINEEVVMMKNANNDCTTSKQNILILTNKGNLYILESLYNSNQRFNTSILNSLKNNEDVTLNLNKVNSSYKVLAITEYYHNSACKSCGRGDLVIYTADGKFRIYDSMQEIESLEKSEICGGPFNIYMTVYENGKVANKDGWFLENKYSGDLILKEIFRNDKGAYLIDHLNYLYTIKNEEGTLKVELYRDTRILKYSKDNNNFRIEFESGHTIDFVNWKYVDEY